MCISHFRSVLIRKFVIILGVIFRAPSHSHFASHATATMATGGLAQPCPCPHRCGPKAYVLQPSVMSRASHFAGVPFRTAARGRPNVPTVHQRRATDHPRFSSSTSRAMPNVLFLFFFVLLHCHVFGLGNALPIFSFHTVCHFPYTTRPYHFQLRTAFPFLKKK